MDTVPVIAEALASRSSRKPEGTRRKRKPARAKKPRVPKLHRPKRESTKTITTRLYKAWAAIVHSYYNDHCAICGKENSKEAPLNAHHIMPRQMFSGLRFDPQNGIALCPKCHKMGKWSAHKGGIWFAEWLRNHAREKYEHCLANAMLDLDCKDRSALYAVESDLHGRYGDAIAPLPMYDVVAYDRKGNKVQSVVRAHNNRAAEFVFWNNWPKTEVPLKGIHKTEELKVNHDAVAKYFRSLPDITMDDIFSKLTLDQLADYLTKGFYGQKMTDDTMSRIRFMLDRWCDAHEVDPGNYVIHGDCHGNVSIAPAVSYEDVAEMKRDLVRRGLMDEDGNALNTRQLPKSTDAASIAIVQEHDAENMENNK